MDLSSAGPKLNQSFRLMRQLLKILETIILSLPVLIGYLFLKGFQSYFWMTWVRWPMKDSSNYNIPLKYIFVFMALSGIVYLSAYLFRRKAFFYLAISAFIGTSFIVDHLTWGIRKESEFVLLWSFQLVAGVVALLIGLYFGNFKPRMNSTEI
jgi:hypothetical protein